ncbi:MAG: DMT family transporter [Polyangiales bacterium]
MRAPSTTTPAAASRDRPTRALGYMLLAAGAFAVMNAFARGLREIPWPMLALSRSVIGLSAALVIARARGASLRVRDGAVMWRRSLFGSTGMVCTFYALTHMPLSDATALLNTTPLWITLIAWWTLRERPGVAVMLALGVAAAGVLLLERPGFAAGQWTGLVALGAGAAGAVAMVSLRRLSGETPEAVVVHFSAVASGVMAALSALWLWRRGAPAGMSGEMLAGVLAMGAAATVGQLAMTRAYALDQAARVGAVGWMQVLFALALDAAVFARAPAASARAGIALLLCAGAILVWDARRRG